MRDVLLHLETVHFDEAPRWYGFDDEGRDVLSWIDGETFADPRDFSDAQLQACARLLRRYHDAVAGSPLTEGHEVVSHGDFGFWNLVWRDSAPIAVLDFDNAHPGARAEDVGYAIWKFSVEDRAAVFIDAYGMAIDAPAAVGLAKTLERQRFARNGWPIDF
jgi:Ser/Thr protein kinase RdoA (MazF antagonist)